jgi:hypothetical protein
MARLVLVSPKGDEVEELFRSREPLMGAFRYQYRYSGIEMPTGLYYVRLIADGKVLKEYSHSVD